jgi:hypothetical protein
MEVSGQLHAPVALLLGNSPRYPGWPPEPVWTGGEKNNLSPLPGIEARFPGCRACSPVAIPTLLRRFFERKIRSLMHSRKHWKTSCSRNARVCVCLTLKIIKSAWNWLNAVCAVPLHQLISTEAIQSPSLQADIPVLRPGNGYFPCPYQAT